MFCVEHFFMWSDGKLQHRSYNQDDVVRLASRVTGCMRTPGTTRVVLSARTVPKRLTSLHVWICDPNAVVSFLDEDGPSVSPSEIEDIIRIIEQPGPAGRFPGHSTQQVLF